MRRSRRHDRRHDDLLSGFNEPGRRAIELRGFFASALGASLVVWELAFDFGAYNTILYYRLFQTVVLALVMLLGALVLRREIAVRPRMFLVLGLPILWLLFRVVAPAIEHTRWYRVVDVLLIAVTVLSLPLILWVVARILAPDYFQLSSRRLRVTAISIVLLVACAGYLVGRYNHRVLICHDFVVAGDFTPPNCDNRPAPEPWFDR